MAERHLLAKLRDAERRELKEGKTKCARETRRC